MKESIISNYVDLNGKVIEREVFRKMLVVLFAGIKFLFDRVVAFVGLIISLPIMIIIAIVIKIDSKGPILFAQKRTGKNGKEFNIYKFRTMVFDNDVRDFSIEDKHTKIGKFLRKTSLDELPQLFSIVIGEMSFIGPRPWIPEYYHNMNELQRHRCDVRPGLTGLAQVMGRNSISIFEKIDYDLIYIKNYSLIQDIKIVFLTINAVFSGKGADAGKSTIKDELESLKRANKKEKKH